MNRLIIVPRAIPDVTPKKPPLIPMIKDSVMKMRRITEPEVPKALSVPISLVLSITDVNNVVTIPIPPTIRETTAMELSLIHI